LDTLRNLPLNLIFADIFKTTSRPPPNALFAARVGPKGGRLTDDQSAFESGWQEQNLSSIETPAFLCQDRQRTPQSTFDDQARFFFLRNSR